MTNQKSQEKVAYLKTGQVYCDVIDKWLPFAAQPAYTFLNDNGVKKAFLSNLRVFGSKKIISPKIVELWQELTCDEPLLGEYIRVTNIIVNSLENPVDVDITYEINIEVPLSKFKVLSWYTPLELRALELDAQKSY